MAYPELEASLFSFNSPKGSCSECHGLGHMIYVDEKKLFLMQQKPFVKAV
jgi:excinuclease ABC subunit A